MTPPAVGDRCLVLSYRGHPAAPPAAAPVREVPRVEVVRVGFRCVLHSDAELVDVLLENGAPAQACPRCERLERMTTAEGVVRALWRISAHVGDNLRRNGDNRD